MENNLSKANNEGIEKEITNMNENHEEKKLNEEQKLNDNRLTEVTGGEAGDGYIYTAKYMCTLCGQAHCCKFTWGDIMHGSHYYFVDEGDHCEKIERMYGIDSFDLNKKIGKISMMATDGGIVSTLFFWLG